MLKGGFKEVFRLRIIAMAIIVSMGGVRTFPQQEDRRCVAMTNRTTQFIFGYDTGQISGFLEMPDFRQKFADQKDPQTGELSFSNWKAGLIVALVSWGVLLSETHELTHLLVVDRYLDGCSHCGPHRRQVWS